MTTLEKPVDVAEYLFKRLSECGVQSVHGVPGDYNLVALDYLPEAGLKWVGSVNELNAGKFFLSRLIFNFCCVGTRHLHHDFITWRCMMETPHFHTYTHTNSIHFTRDIRLLD